MAKPDMSRSSGARRTNELHKAPLQQRLHSLLDRMHDTTELLKQWPTDKATDDNDVSVHVENTTQLIGHLHSVVDAIKAIEEKVIRGDGSQSDNELIDKLSKCQVPLDLLDLMDSCQGTFGINPDIFMRGLLQEAIRQLAGLMRRKLALEMLGGAIQNGLDRRERVRALEERLRLEDEAEAEAKRKRKREDEPEESSHNLSENVVTAVDPGEQERPAKRQK
eukprot:scaffold231279_cov45-Attheya_sp.AAC.2